MNELVDTEPRTLKAVGVKKNTNTALARVTLFESKYEVNLSHEESLLRLGKTS